MPEANKVYVEKVKYDILLRKYLHTKHLLDDLTESWEELKRRTNMFDDHVLQSIHRFGTLQEENAYIIGAFNTLMAFQEDIKELEEEYNDEDSQ